MNKNILSAILLFFVLTIITGAIYPLTVTTFAQVFFKEKAEGSLVKREDGKVIGSMLIGQNFNNCRYFFGRISAANYIPLESTGSNASATGRQLKDQISARYNQLKECGDKMEKVPIELLTASGSGIDPEISPEALYFQAERIALIRNISKEKVENVIRHNTIKKFIGVFGAERVNLLSLNMALDKLE